jgi:methylthioribose-1-phosphate isomerase
VECRLPDEVCRINGARVTPEGTEVWNPAFDVTPGRLIHGLITERGILKLPLA